MSEYEFSLTRIFALYEKIRVRENVYSYIFYAEKVSDLDLSLDCNNDDIAGISL